MRTRPDAKAAPSRSEKIATGTVALIAMTESLLRPLAAALLPPPPPPPGVEFDGVGVCEGEAELDAVKNAESVAVALAVAVADAVAVAVALALAVALDVALALALAVALALGVALEERPRTKSSAELRSEGSSSVPPAVAPATSTGGESSGSPRPSRQFTAPVATSSEKRLPSSQATKAVPFEPIVTAEAAGAAVPLLSVADQTTEPAADPFARKTPPPRVATSTPRPATTAGAARTAEAETATGSHVGRPVAASSATRLFASELAKTSAPSAETATEARTAALIGWRHSSAPERALIPKTPKSSQPTKSRAPAASSAGVVLQA